MSFTDNAELIRYHLLSELVAEGHADKEGHEFFYRGVNQDYRIGLILTARNKTVRLTED